MRRLYALLLLCCFTLYHFGYYAVYFSVHIVIEKYWADITPQLDVTAGMERVMEIPLSIPYLAEEVDFRATNIQFEKNGQVFRAIKQRYTEESLQIIYVPDTAQNNLNLAVRQWVNSLTQDGMPSSGQDLLLLKMFAKDYVKSEQFRLLVPKQTIQHTVHRPYLSSVIEYFSEVTSPPPQLS